MFSIQYESDSQVQSLAERMRPVTLEEYIGQAHIVGPTTPLYRAIQNDQVRSIILYGPPGCGKTSLVHLISKYTEGEYVELSAVDVSLKQLREMIDRARENQSLYGVKTLLFMDELHRLHRSGQDALLSPMEKGTIIFIGATTESPFHYVNDALRSRSTLLRLHPLTKDDVAIALERALVDSHKGLGKIKLCVAPAAIDHIAAGANGDIRRALHAIELAALTAPSQEDGTFTITLEMAKQCMGTTLEQGDEASQYDVLSAFHKSIRASNPAALFWCLYGVEKLEMNPTLFLRRLLAATSEDIGLANPQAMGQAVYALQAYEHNGWVEGKLNVAQAILFAVQSPKCNDVYTAVSDVMSKLEQTSGIRVPFHLRNTAHVSAQQNEHNANTHSFT